MRSVAPPFVASLRLLIAVVNVDWEIPAMSADKLCDAAHHPQQQLVVHT
jgi:hypothetical protein